MFLFTVINIEDLVPDVLVRTRSRETDAETGRQDCTEQVNLLSDEEEEDISENTCLINGSSACTPQHRQECQTLIDNYKRSTLPPLEEEEELLMVQERDTYQHTRHVIMILMLLTSAFVVSLTVHFTGKRS